MAAMNPYAQSRPMQGQPMQQPMQGQRPPDMPMQQPMTQPTQNLGFGGSVQWGTTSGAPANMPPPASNVPGMSNPYLGAQANAIQQQANQNLQYNHKHHQQKLHLIQIQNHKAYPYVQFCL